MDMRLSIQGLKPLQPIVAIMASCPSEINKETTEKMQEDANNNAIQQEQPDMLSQDGMVSIKCTEKNH
jgi:hypothetical protein